MEARRSRTAGGETRARSSGRNWAGYHLPQIGENPTAVGVRGRRLEGRDGCRGGDQVAGGGTNVGREKTDKQEAEEDSLSFSLKEPSKGAENQTYKAA